MITLTPSLTNQRRGFNKGAPKWVEDRVDLILTKLRVYRNTIDLGLKIPRRSFSHRRPCCLIDIVCEPANICQGSSYLPQRG